MIVRTVCPHDCPDQCSILAEVDDNRVVRVSGDPDHPFTQGFLCVKVNRYEERVHSPARVLHPLRRVGPKGEGQFAPISWDNALTEIVGRWQGIIAQYGPDALLGYTYSGTMGMINRHIPLALFNALGAARVQIGTVCDSAGETGWAYSVGEIPGTDPETVVDSDLIIAWGANTVTTNVHLVPFIDRAVAKGARLVVIDPCRTRTAARAHWHIRPRVGTDTALALGVMHVLDRDGLADRAYMTQRTSGFDRLQAEVLPHYTPELVAEITGVSAGEIERLARMYGEARAPFIRLGGGMSRCAGGGMMIRTIACLPAMVGAWEKPGGGALQDIGAAWDFNCDALRRPDLRPRPVTRTVNHSHLGRALVELQGPPIMGFFVAGNNPAVTCPDAGRIAAGLRREDLFTVVHDTFLSDTARYADIVLPAVTSFESEDLFRCYGAYYTQFAPQVIPPQGEARSNAWLTQQLAGRFGLTDPVFTRSTREHLEALLAGTTGPTAELTLDQLMAGGPVRLDYRRKGPERTYFYSEGMLAAGLPPMPEWQPDPHQASEAPDRLRLLIAPAHFQHHTIFAGVESLQQAEGEPRCLLHPADAAAKSIQDGQAVELFNELGSVGLRARVTDATQPGLVVVEGQRNKARFLSGGPINVLVADRLSDLGEGATFQSTWVEIRPL